LCLSNLSKLIECCSCTSFRSARFLFTASSLENQKRYQSATITHLSRANSSDINRCSVFLTSNKDCSLLISLSSEKKKRRE
jgi:hypothetical protein